MVTSLPSSAVAAEAVGVLGVVACAAPPLTAMVDAAATAPATRAAVERLNRRRRSKVLPSASGVGRCRDTRRQRPQRHGCQSVARGLRREPVGAVPFLTPRSGT